MNKILFERIKELSGVDFSASKDRDFPSKGFAEGLGTDEVVLFDEREKYRIEGQTHDMVSHAIKHVISLDRSLVDSVVTKVKNILKNQENIIIRNFYGKPIAVGEEAVKRLNLNNIINTFDRLHDKMINKYPLHDIEKKLIPLMNLLTNRYQKEISKFGDNLDIDRSFFSDIKLKDKMKEGRVVRFQSTNSHGKSYYYYFNYIDNTIMVREALGSGREGKILTMFVIDELNPSTGKSMRYISNLRDLSPRAKRILGFT